MRRRCRVTRPCSASCSSSSGSSSATGSVNAYLDGAASIANGLLLMSVAGILAPGPGGLLLGEGVNPDELADIRRCVESDPSVERAGDILAMYIGPHDPLVNTGMLRRRYHGRADARGDPTHWSHPAHRASGDQPRLQRGRVAANR